MVLLSFDVNMDLQTREIDVMCFHLQNVVSIDDQSYSTQSEGLVEMLLHRQSIS